MPGCGRKLTMQMEQTNNLRTCTQHIPRKIWNITILFVGHSHGESPRSHTDCCSLVSALRQTCWYCYVETLDSRRWLWWDTGCQKVIVLRHWMSEGSYGETYDVRRWFWWDTGRYKLVVRRRMSESGCGETQDVRRWLWWDAGCQKVFVVRHRMLEGGYGETQDFRKCLWWDTGC